MPTGKTRAPGNDPAGDGDWKEIVKDALTFGVPVLGEIASALADAGFLVVRYDKDPRNNMSSGDIARAIRNLDEQVVREPEPAFGATAEDGGIDPAEVVPRFSARNVVGCTGRIH